MLVEGGMVVVRVEIRRRVTAVVPAPPRHWDRDAPCLGMDPDGFYATPWSDEPAERSYYSRDMPWRSVCPTCTVRASCLANALLRREGWGVWGGMPPRARDHLLVYLLEGLMSWDRVEAAFEAEAGRRGA
jgi:hypothetical protein